MGLGLWELPARSCGVRVPAEQFYRDLAQALVDVFDYIEWFYNPTWRHSTLSYVSHVQFEEAQKALAGVNATGCSPLRAVSVPS